MFAHSLSVATNGLQLQEVGDFGALNCLPPLNLIRSTKLHLTTEPPISCRCCYSQFFFSFRVNLSSSSFPFFPHQFVSISVVVVVRHLFWFTSFVKFFYPVHKVYYLIFVVVS